MPDIEVIQRGSRYIAKCSFLQKELVKSAGFRWDRDNKVWFTTDPSVAASLVDPEARRLAEERRAQMAVEKKQAIEDSRAQDADVELPVPDGLAYLPYQRAGIAFALRHPSVLFGDEMGLGKTIQAIGVINSDPSIRSILVMCPASLRLNWQRELRKWLVREFSIAIASSRDWPAGYNIIICNYDIATKLQDKLRARTWDLVILDEMHYLKSAKAKRTVAVLGRTKTKKQPAILGLSARRKVGLTGTPIPNRPVEGWPIFNYLAPETFKSFWTYANRFCNAHNNGYGWDMSGSSNLPELQDLLRSTIMVRRKKMDVLTELPAKRRQLVELDASECSHVIGDEVAAWERQETEIDVLRQRVELAKAADSQAEYDDAVTALRARTQAAFTEISKLRHATALAKMPQVVEHIQNALEDGTQKLIVFAHHRDVIRTILDSLAEANIEAVSITGDTAMYDRQKAVDAFQQDADVRVFVGNIQAAGVGLTLTAAAHVIFAELDWVPGNVSQAEDRAHRIGQVQSVLVQHLVLDGSLDAKMAKTLISKQEVIDAALDNERAAIAESEGEATPAKERAATESVTRDALGELAKQMTPERIEAVHRGLQSLAAMDGDRAREVNGMGFSKIDVGIGHDLANRGWLTPRQAALGSKLVNKYRRQLSEDLVAAATGKAAE